MCGIRTNESSDLGVDDAAGEEVKVILHRVDHHSMSCVVAALQRRDDEGTEKQRSMRLMEVGRQAK